MDKRRLSIVGVMLMLSVVNYSRIKGSDEVRPILFLSILAMGILAGVLIIGVIDKLRNKGEKSE